MKMKKGLTLLILAGLSFSLPSRYVLPPPEKPKEEKRIQQKKEERKDPLSVRVSVNVRNFEDLRHLLSLISDEAGISIEMRDWVFLRKVYGDEMRVSYFAYNKPLRAILDEIASMWGLWWEYDPKARKVVMYRYKPVVFDVKLPVLETKISLDRGFFVLDFKKDYLKDLEKKLRSVLLDENSKLSVSPSGQVVGLLTPKEAEAVEKLVRKINKQLSTPIPLNVKVVLVKLEDRNKTGVDWKVLLSESPRASLELLGSTLMQGTVQPVFRAGVLSASVEGVLSLLSERFDYRILQDTYLNAYSGFPVVYAPLRSKRIIKQYTVSYLTSGTTGAVATTPQVSLETEDVVEGSITVIAPRYLDGDRITLELYREDSRILELVNKQVEVQGFTNEITLPTLSQGLYSLKAQLKKGQTLVLVSDVMDSKELQNAGIPFLKDVPLLGKIFGYEADGKTRYQVLIFISYLDKERTSAEEIRRPPLLKPPEEEKEETYGEEEDPF